MRPPDPEDPYDLGTEPNPVPPRPTRPKKPSRVDVPAQQGSEPNWGWALFLLLAFVTHGRR